MGRDQVAGTVADVFEQRVGAFGQRSLETDASLLEEAPVSAVIGVRLTIRADPIDQISHEDTAIGASEMAWNASRKAANTASRAAPVLARLLDGPFMVDTWFR